MNKNYPFNELKNLIDQAAGIEIYLPNEPKFDQVAAALALKLALVKQGKNASVLSTSPMIVEFSHLVGVEKIGEKSTSGRDLVISLNYPLDQIEKVSYNDEGGRLNLVVQPKENAPKLEENQATFSYQGAGQSLTIIVAASNPGKLGQFSNQIDLANAVNIDNSPDNSNFGKLNIIDQCSSVSEMMVAIIANLGLPADQDIAGNLLLGMENITDNFSNDKAAADTFEAAAICLRWGAKRAAKTTSQPQPVFNARPVSRPFRPTPPKEQKQNPAPSPNWFEPKVFKGTNV